MTTLWAWAAAEKQRIDAFVRWWEGGQISSGFSDFPEDLPKADWGEQYRAWTRSAESAE